MSLLDHQKCGFLRPAVWHQLLNVTLCLILTLILFGYVRRHVFIFPITMEAVWQISLAEINRRKSKRRTRKLNESIAPADFEKGSLAPARCLASVVGYREELGLFTKALKSYRDCPGMEVLLVGIDGNESQDMEMANVVLDVFPATTTTFITLNERLADRAVRHAREYVARELRDGDHIELPIEWTWDDLSSRLRNDAQTFAMDQAYAWTAEILTKHDILHTTRGSSRTICISQPHISKKGIMFTNMVFSTVLGRVNHIPYLWTSDSDTWVTPTTIPLTIGCMEPDPQIGGSCSLLGIHNGDKSFISHLGSAIYWAELAITRGQTGAIDAVDCQPGPCAAFRLSALSPNLFAWYTQTSMGIKTIVNEDRHLTTQLLLDGWKVTFNTEAIAFTDTPTTLLRWLLQQIRWARATQIETFQYPLVYAIHGPIFFLTALNRVYGPLAVMIFTIRYALTGDVVRAYSIYDVLLRVVLCTSYNYITHHRHVCSLAFLALSQVFYQIPLPGIIVYASVTALEGGWGTSMRNRKESRKARGAGWDHLGSITAVAVWTAFVSAALTRLLFESYLVEFVSVSGAVLYGFMTVSAGFTVAALYYALLGRNARA